MNGGRKEAQGQVVLWISATTSAGAISNSSRRGKAADDHLSTVVKEVKLGRYRSPEDLPTLTLAPSGGWTASATPRRQPSPIWAPRRNHLVPVFGPLRIDRVTPEAVEEFQQRKWNGGNGMARDTVNQILLTPSAVSTTPSVSTTSRATPRSW